MSSNRALLPYFIDFILSSLPFMKSSFRIIVLPVIRVTREQLLLKCNTLERSYTGVDMNVSTDSQLDMEIILLLTGLEKIITFCINDELLANGATGARKGTDTVYGLRGITDLVTGVFAGGDSADDRGDEKLRELLFDQILESLRVVEHVWRVITRADAESKPREIIDHLQSTPKRIRHRLRRVVESFYELLPRETMEMLLELWVQANPFVTKGGEVELVIKCCRADRHTFFPNQ